MEATGVSDYGGTGKVQIFVGRVMGIDKGGYRGFGHGGANRRKGKTDPVQSYAEKRLSLQED